MSDLAALVLFYLACYLAAVLAWFYYVAVMHLLKVREQLHPVAKVHAYGFIAVGLVFDVLLNWIVGTALFLEPPRELLLTQRLKRLKPQGGWRARVAHWVCEHLLNQFDEGHC